MSKLVLGAVLTHLDFLIFLRPTPSRTLPMDIDIEEGRRGYFWFKIVSGLSEPLQDCAASLSSGLAEQSCQLQPQ